MSRFPSLTVEGAPEPSRPLLQKIAQSSHATWEAAQQVGWSDAQLAEAFAYLGLTVFTGYFLNYAQTDPDV